MGPTPGPYILQFCMGPSYLWRGLNPPDPPLFRTLASMAVVMSLTICSTTQKQICQVQTSVTKQHALMLCWVNSQFTTSFQSTLKTLGFYVVRDALQCRVVIIPVNNIILWMAIACGRFKWRIVYNSNMWKTFGTKISNFPFSCDKVIYSLLADVPMCCFSL